MKEKKYYLLFKCGCHIRGLIVARGLKGIAETFKETVKAHHHVVPERLLHAEVMEPPEGFSEAVEFGVRRSEINSFGHMAIWRVSETRSVPYDEVDRSGLFRKCSAVPAEDDEGHWRCSECYGHKVVPVNYTWSELYDRSKTIPPPESDFQRSKLKRG